MSKHVTLPGPPKPIVGHQANTLDIEGRLCHHLERSELEYIPPELLAERQPRDLEERCDPSVAYEVRHVRIPISHQPPVSKATEKQKFQDPRARHFVCKRESALHRSQVEQVNRNDEVGAESRDALCTAWSSPQRRHVALEQLKQLLARGLRPLPAATCHDEGQT